MDLSIIIPAFNEEKRLPAFMRSIISYLKAKEISAEIIVVDDGSEDGTSEVAEKFKSMWDGSIILERLEYNMGKGFAVRHGMLKAKGRYRLFCDADGSTPIEELDRLMLQMKETGSDIAIGSRAIKSDDTKVIARWYRKLSGRIFNFIMNLIIVPDIKDTQCGFKLFTQRSAEAIFSLSFVNGFAFDIEVLFLARKLGFKVIEVPINWHHVHGSKVSLIYDSPSMVFDALTAILKHRTVKGK
ncbi:MAG: glycosyltransferase family 2 protein [Candidatus Dadabacteria bacterium]|nr:MAG: glycosyltransferase family 2 protein [Candidatus Dadabacteria bacterium]